ncbi:MAG: sensor histidine kinase [Chloroflexi bacterium]|nr:sensor histidine kinase [Chloroflexota bacterium]
MVVLLAATYITVFVDNAFSSNPRIVGVFQMSALVVAGVGLGVMGVYDDYWVEQSRPLSSALYLTGEFALFLLTGYLSQAHGQWWMAGLLIIGISAKLSDRWLAGVSLGVLLSILGVYYAVYRDVTLFYQIPLFIAPAIFFMALFTRLADRERQTRQEMEQLAMELRLANHKLSEYAARVEEMAIIQERNRMAREIHDSLGHYLTVVNVQIGAAQAVMEKHPEKAISALQKAQKLTQEGLAEVRQSVSALRDTAEERPLREQLADLAAETEATGLPTHLQVWGEPRPLDSQTTRTLYRAAQEALTNARKHSAASQITLTLDYINLQEVRLVVQDNGRGSANPTGGYGLLGLRERVQLLGGRVEITTAEGQGFMVAVTLSSEK